MKKKFLIYIIMVSCVLVLSGCSFTNGYDGKDLIDKAKTLHTQLEAAHIRVQDRSGGHIDDGAVVQEIWYRFQGDVMQYMYIGRDAQTGEEYYEFNNGTELDMWHTGDAEWSFAAKGSENYYGYSRAKRHYFADGALFLNDYAAAVRSASVRNEGDGFKVVDIEYDDSRIAQYEQMQGVTDYRQEFWISSVSGGYCSFYDVIYNKAGEEYHYWIVIDIPDPGAPIERVEPNAPAPKTENTQ